MTTRLVLVALLAIPAAAPQSDPKWLSSGPWFGSVRLTIHSKGEVNDKENNTFIENSWDETEEFFFECRMSLRKAEGKIFRGIGAKPPAEKGRWANWENSRIKDDYGFHWVSGEGTSKTLIKMTGEAESPLSTERKTTKNRHGVGKTYEKLFLQVDVKDGLYAFSFPGMLANSKVDCREHFVKEDRQPTIPPKRTSGDDKSRSVAKGQVDAHPEMEITASEVKILDQKLPAEPEALKGSLTANFKTTRRGTGKVDSKVQIQWIFTPVAPEIELEFEAEGSGAKNWADWRPVGGKDEQTPGSEVKLTATVLNRAGPLTDKPRWIRFVLNDVSAEKGICLNYPLNAAEPPERDLQFRNQENRGMNFGEGRISTPYDPPTPTFTARLACLDHGAWGEVHAEALLDSGRRILGRVKGKPQESLIRIPERSEKSRIAAVWKSPGDDDADDETEPPGDGQKGDGLTLYEEYRGFYVNGAWTDTDPKTKEFFIHNKSGKRGEDGLKQFESLSKLKVRRLGDGEMTPERVVNFNRSQGPNKVDQHGILMRDEPTFKGYCWAVEEQQEGRPGRPKDIKFVGIGPIAEVPRVTWRGTKETWEQYHIAGIAHELFHCVNVYHHGDEVRGYEDMQVWTRDASGQIFENGKPITVLNEAGEPLPTLTFVKDPTTGVETRKVMVHQEGGTASGNVACVMRYDDSDAILRPAAPNVRYLLGPGDDPEVVGGGLCRDGKATGTNLFRGLVAPPRPGRFGDANPKRGNCAAQIVVNDAAKRTDRR